MVKKEEIEKLKNILQSKRAELLDELKKMESMPEFGSDVDSYDEEADEAEEFSSQVAIGEKIRTRIREIDKALYKITQGRYGICENCNKEISITLLNEVPESELCIECKKKAKSCLLNG